MFLKGSHTRVHVETGQKHFDTPGLAGRLRLWKTGSVNTKIPTSENELVFNLAEREIRNGVLHCFSLSQRLVYFLINQGFKCSMCFSWFLSITNKVVYKWYTLLSDKQGEKPWQQISK